MKTKPNRSSKFLKRTGGKLVTENIGLLRLPRGRFAIVDWRLYCTLSRYSWYQLKAGYVARNVQGRPHPRITELLHRRVAGTPPGLVTDHINRWVVDCTVRNLRGVTQSHNLVHQDKNRPWSTSRYKGVHWNSYHQLWRSAIGRKHVGYYDTEEEAARAYDAAVVAMFGGCAQTNF